MFGLALVSGVNTEVTLKGFKTTFNTSPPSKPQSLWTRFHLQIPTVWSFLLKSLNWKPKPLNDHGSPTSEEITLMYYQPKTALTGPDFCASLRYLKNLWFSTKTCWNTPRPSASCTVNTTFAQAQSGSELWAIEKPKTSIWPRWQRCYCHRDVGDSKLGTILESWRQNFDIGDIFWIMVPDAGTNIFCRQLISSPTSVTNIDVTADQSSPESVESAGKGTIKLIVSTKK